MVSLSSTPLAEDTHFNFPAQISFSPSLSQVANYWRHPFQLSCSNLLLSISLSQVAKLLKTPISTFLLKSPSLPLSISSSQTTEDTHFNFPDHKDIINVSFSSEPEHSNNNKRSERQDTHFNFPAHKDIINVCVCVCVGVHTSLPPCLPPCLPAAASSTVSPGKNPRKACLFNW